MNPQLIEDPRAAKRSLMNLQKTLCNGEKTGSQCKHYWAITKKVDVPNPDHLRRGENIRYCLVDTSNATSLGNNGCDMMVYCNKYTESENPYDPAYEVYNPLPPEDVEKLMSPDELAEHNVNKAKIEAENALAAKAEMGSGISGVARPAPVKPKPWYLRILP